MPNSANATDRRQFNILFTCVGKRVELIGAFKRTLKARGFVGHTIGCDINMAAPAMHHVDRVEIAPRVSDPSYLDFLRGAIAKHRADMLIPLTDLDLQLLADHRAELEADGCEVMISDAAAIALCRDKIRFCRYVAEAGLAAIETFTLEEFLDKPFYPCFAKPVSGSAAIGARLIQDPRELEAHIVEVGRGLMIQQYIPGSEYTVDVLRRRDGVVCAVVPRQRLEVRAGEVTKGLTIRDEQIIQAAGALVESLPGLRGVFNLQCRRTPGDRPRFFELNPRFGGGAPLSIAAGVDLPGMLIDQHLGRLPEPAIGRFADRLLMLRYDHAVFTAVDDPSRLPGYDDPVHR